MFKSRKIFTIKLNGQYANEDYLASADQFYIGGINSVRGYKESILSGDSGFSLSAELSVPDRSSTEWVFFADGGSVFGGSAFDDHTLYSVGAGYRLRMGNWLTSSLMLGLPMAQEEALLPEEVLSRWYASRDMHTFFLGKVVRCYYLE